MDKRLLFTAFFLLPVFYAAGQNHVGPSPNSMGIVRLANQVNHYTGSPGINIPLTSLSGKELGVSVSLSYNSFGHRVQDVASSVGLGWNLMAGGLITRVVKGLPDDLTGGYCKPNPTDEEPDVYTFSVNGLSGKFVLDKNGIPILMPFQDIIIKPGICKTSPDGQWEIIDQNGTRYIFGSVLETREITTYNIGATPGNRTFISTWLLEKIISANGTDEVNFTYVAGSFSYENYSFYRDSGTSSIIQNQSAYITQHARNISSITTSGGSILFEYDSYREDLTGGKSLKSVKVLDHTGAKVNQLTFAYGYFGPSGSVLCRRLKLDAIFDLATAPLYSFTYNTTENLPCRDSKNIDYLGLFNNNTINDWIPATTDPVLAGASREPHAAKMKANLLQTISTRGGGSTNFTYEPNRGKFGTVNYSIVSGNRILSISSSDGNGNVSTVNYEYKLQNGEHSGVISKLPLYRLNAQSIQGQVTRRFSHSIGDLFDLNGTMIGYSRVEESEIGKGKTIYTFTNYNTNQDIGSDSLFTKSTRFWERGLPTGIVVMDQTSKIIYKEYFQYDLDLPIRRTVTGKEKLVFSYSGGSKTFTNTYSLISKPLTLKEKSVTTYDQNDPTKRITRIEQYNYLTSTYQLLGTTSYDSLNSNEKIITVNKYITHPDYTYSTSNCYSQYVACIDNCTNGGGSNCESTCNTQYNNCVYSVYSNLNNFAKPIQKMRERHMNNVVVESQSFIQKGSTKYLLGASVTKFLTHGLQERVYPQSQWISKKTTATNYTGSKINSSGVFEVPSIFVETGSYIFDIASGKMTNESGRDGSTAQYTYSNNNTTMASLISNPGSNPFTTSYLYRPLIGVTKETDTNGKAVNMEYDGMNRLRLVKDHNNDIRERYRYHYRNETPNFKIAANPVQILAGQSVTFSLEDILVPSGGTTIRHWNTGNGPVYTDNRQTMTHTYQNPGLYVVSATLHTNEFSPVTRTYQLLVTAPLQITVCADGAQEKDFCNPNNTVNGSCTSFPATPGYTTFRANFSTLQSTGCAGVYTYQWHYRLAFGSWISFGNNSNSAVFLHDHNQTGYYEVRCTITDSCNTTVIATSYINLYKSIPGCTPIEN